MPRPKVEPQLRKRVALACDSCRVSKRRCDGRNPCSMCVRRRRAQSCSYLSVQCDQSPQKDVVASNSPAQLGTGVPRTFRYGIGGEQHGFDAPITDVQSASHSDNSLQIPTGSMRRNARGESMYINATSGLSFLNFLKTVLKDRLGPCDFTNETRSADSLHESSGHEKTTESVEIDNDTRKDLINCFAVATSGILDIFEPDEINEFFLSDVVASHPTSGHNSLITAASDLIIAIGAQSRSSSPADAAIAATKSAHGRKLAFEEQLENPSLNLLRVFLLLAFYMVGASRRHAAVMHIGVASTTALMLGLHDTDHYSKLPRKQSNLRWRVYRALVIFDLVNATLLGRNLLSPSLTKGIPSLYNDAMETDSSPSATSFAICRTIRTAVDSLASTRQLDFAWIEELTRTLASEASAWKQSQQHLFQVSKQDLPPDLADRVGMAGRLHASCIYYHTLVLVTRSPFVKCLTELRKGSTDTTEDFVRNLDSMSKICVDASICAVETCWEAFEAGLLLNNMCHIIRPVLFETGLILGFFLALCPLDAGHISSAFRKSRKLLGYFAKTGALSKVFYEILSGLWDAVVKLRTDILSTQPTFSDVSVGRLLQFSDQQSGSNIDPATEVLPSTGPGTPGSAPEFVDMPNIDYSSIFSDNQEWQLFAQQFSEFLPIDGWMSASEAP